ncbi:MAG TPA: ABC transporter ATP-binding protein [Candidatus Dormibacteraeota bacterium]|nr:ABC transporter ATP-binding protein [Candidatus Dormibacteraeota bacterium]
MIRVEHLAVSYRRSDGAEVRAVEDVSFSVREGEFVTLIGPSGCGKTSLLRVMGGLLRPAAGQVYVNDVLVKGPMPDAIAYVFQDFALFPWRTARANVEIALQLKRVPRGERRRRALDALDMVGLAEVADRFPRELSGGMQQRLAVARALVSNCGILLLDEPFGALDEQTRLVLGVQLSQLLESAGRTIVFVTHSLQEAVFLSDRILVLSHQPCRIKKTVEVPLPRPRGPDQVKSPAGQRIEAELFQLLYRESLV